MTESVPQVFRVTAVLDGRTCDHCVMWHGRLVERSALVSIGHHCDNEKDGCRCVGEEVIRGGVA